MIKLILLIAVIIFIFFPKKFDLQTLLSAILPEWFYEEMIKPEFEAKEEKEEE